MVFWEPPARSRKTEYIKKEVTISSLFRAAVWKAENHYDGVRVGTQHIPVSIRQRNTFRTWVVAGRDICVIVRTDLL